MSMKDLKKAVKKSDKSRGDFGVGTVIRWRASDRYDYAALKAGDGKWYTTAQSHNTYVQGSYTWTGLLEVLQRAETTNVRVSTCWQDPTAEVEEPIRVGDNEVDEMVEVFSEAASAISLVPGSPIRQGLVSVMHYLAALGVFDYESDAE